MDFIDQRIEKGCLIAYTTRNQSARPEMCLGIVVDPQRFSVKRVHVDEVGRIDRARRLQAGFKRSVVIDVDQIESLTLRLLIQAEQREIIRA
jgi:hypothetical protein